MYIKYDIIWYCFVFAYNYYKTFTYENCTHNFLKIYGTGSWSMSFDIILYQTALSYRWQKRQIKILCLSNFSFNFTVLLFFSTINAENKGYNSVIICAFVKTYEWSLFYYDHNINFGKDLILTSLTFYNMWGLITWQRSKKQCNTRINFVFLSI